MNNKYVSHSTFTYLLDPNFIIQRLRYIVRMPDLILLRIRIM